MRLPYWTNTGDGTTGMDILAMGIVEIAPIQMGLAKALGYGVDHSTIERADDQRMEYTYQLVYKFFN